MCVLTVVSLMWSSRPISAFERPRAIRRNTSSSRSVSSSSAFGGVGRGVRVNCSITRLVTAGEERVASRDGADGGEELFGRVVLEHEPAGAEREAPRRRTRRGRTSSGSGSAPCRRRRGCAASLRDRRARHADVHQHDGRCEARSLVDRLEPVARLGDDFDVGLAESSMRKKRGPSTGRPRRARGWSCCVVLDREPGGEDEAAVGCRPGRHLAAVDLDALAPTSPWPSRRSLPRRRRRRALRARRGST